MSDRLGHYELLSKLGSGGMGTVWRAQDLRTGLPVAIKLLHPHLASDRDYVRRFQREARIVSSIDSPDVVRVLEYGHEGDAYFLVMEFVDGQTLAQLIRKQGRLSLQQTLSVVAAVARALDAAQRVGVVHRDIKPQNIMIAADGRVKVTDFGVARAAAMTALTLTGSFMGTPAYTAPEVAAGLAVDARADIYALGVVLFESLTGRVPFSADTPWGLITLHERATPPSLAARRPEVPVWLAAVYERCLEKSPGNRFQTPAALLAAIETGGPPEGPRLRATSRRPPRMLVVGTGVLGVALMTTVIAAMAALSSDATTANQALAPASTPGPSGFVPSTENLSAAEPTLEPTLLPSATPPLFNSPTPLPNDPGQSGDSVVYKSALVYRASLSGMTSDLRTNSPGACGGVAGGADSSSSMRYIPGAIELEIHDTRGWRVLEFTSRQRTRYLQEFELAFQPGSDFAVWSRLRWTDPRGLNLAIWPGREEMNLLIYDSQSGVTTEVSGYVPIQGLQTGRIVEIGVAVDTNRYTVFLDGRKVIEYVNDEFGSSAQALQISGLGCNGGTGAMRILGARVYELTSN